MSPAQGKLVKALLIAVIIILVLWSGHTLEAGPRAYHYLTAQKQLPDTTKQPGSFATHVVGEAPSVITAEPGVFTTKSSSFTPTSTAELVIYTDEPVAPIKGQNFSDTEITELLDAIFHDAGKNTSRMECPDEQAFHPRYEILRQIESPGIQYLFSLDLYQSASILNRLVSSIIQAIRVLGPERCSLSIIEGRSTDGTYVVLDNLKSLFEEMGVKYWLHQSSIDPYSKGHDRIEELANLRNQAIEPILAGTNGFVANPQIVFLNDILPCPDDILELVYQHKLQDATQTCAMDWIEKGENFYDVWVSRSMTGNIFWEIPQSGEWTYVQNLFWDDPFTKKKFQAGQPFQVFSCWGGMTVMEAAPFQHDNLRFRRNVDGECYGGEPQLLGMDLAKLNISKVQTIPAVNIGYNSDYEGLLVKKLRKYVHEKVDVTQRVLEFEDDTHTQRIHWKPPPAKIRCMPDMGQTIWVDPWYDPNKKEDE